MQFDLSPALNASGGTLSALICLRNNCLLNRCSRSLVATVIHFAVFLTAQLQAHTALSHRSKTQIRFESKEFGGIKRCQLNLEIHPLCVFCVFLAVLCYSYQFFFCYSTHSNSGFSFILRRFGAGKTVSYLKCNVRSVFKLTALGCLPAWCEHWFEIG